MVLVRNTGRKLLAGSGIDRQAAPIVKGRNIAIDRIAAVPETDQDTGTGVPESRNSRDIGASQTDMHEYSAAAARGQHREC